MTRVCDLNHSRTLFQQPVTIRLCLVHLQCQIARDQIRGNERQNQQKTVPSCPKSDSVLPQISRQSEMSMIGVGWKGSQRKGYVTNSGPVAHMLIQIVWVTGMSGTTGQPSAQM